MLKQGLVEGGAFSVISRIEVLGFSQPPEELEKASRLFAGLNQIELNAQIVAQTIALQQFSFWSFNHEEHERLQGRRR